MQVKFIKNVSAKDFQRGREYLNSLKAKFDATTKIWTIAEGLRKSVDGEYYIADGSPLAAVCPTGEVFKTYGKNNYPCNQITIQRFLFDFDTVEVVSAIPQD